MINEFIKDFADVYNAIEESLMAAIKADEFKVIKKILDDNPKWFSKWVADEKLDIDPNVVHAKVIAPLSEAMVEDDYLPKCRQYIVTDKVHNYEAMLSAWLADFVLISEMYESEGGGCVASRMLEWITNQNIQIKYIGKEDYDDAGYSTFINIESMGCDNELLRATYGKRMHPMFEDLIIPAVKALIELINEAHKNGCTKEEPKKEEQESDPFKDYFKSRVVRSIGDIFSMIFGDDEDESEDNECDGNCDECFMNNTDKHEFKDKAANNSKDLEKVMENLDNKSDSKTDDEKQMAFDSGMIAYIHRRFNVPFEEAEEIVDVFDLDDDNDIRIISYIVDENEKTQKMVDSYCARYAGERTKQVNYLHKKYNINEVDNTSADTIKHSALLAVSALRDIVKSISLPEYFIVYIDPERNTIELAKFDRYINAICNNFIRDYYSNLDGASRKFYQALTVRCNIYNKYIHHYIKQFPQRENILVSEDCDFDTMVIPDPNNDQRLIASPLNYSDEMKKISRIMASSINVVLAAAKCLRALDENE